MKQLLSFFLTFLVLTSYAQKSVWFTGISADSARAISDTIASYSKEKCTFVQSDVRGQFNNIVIFRYAKKGSDDELEIPFKVYNIGENKDLGITGKPTYFFYQISGLQLMDIFPFWKGFIQPDADIENIANTDYENHKKIVAPANGKEPAKAAFLSKRGDVWQLYIQ